MRKTLPVLSIVTRHYVKRPKLFDNCVESVKMQTCDDYEHIILEDTVGRGVDWANKQFERHAKDVGGDYVFILDDDDRLITDRFVTLVSRIKSLIEPDLIVVKMNHGKRLGILPNDAYWGIGLPPFSNIGVSAVIPKREIWVDAVKCFAPRTGGDYPFIKKCFELADEIIWIDEVVSECQVGPMYGGSGDG